LIENISFYTAQNYIINTCAGINDLGPV